MKDPQKTNKNLNMVTECPKPKDIEREKKEYLGMNSLNPFLIYYMLWVA